MALGTPLHWYARRLASMPPAEVAHRLSEQWRRRALRAHAGGWSRIACGVGEIEALPAFVAMLAASSESDAALSDAAARVMNGDFIALGRAWPRRSDSSWCGDAWFLDPVTGKPWPGAGTFCFDVEYRHNAQFGDVKYVWEPNRLQFLLPVAAAAVRGRDDRLARYAVDTVLSWMDANPPFTGTNWASGIEIALRLVSLAVVVAGARLAMSASERAQFRRFVVAHAEWLERFPSLYSSANNHRVAEGLGLLIASLLAPDLPRAARYLAHGRAILHNAASNQFHPDGIGVEQSPTYAAFTLEMLCVGGFLLQKTRNAFDAVWLEAVARAAAALRAMLDEQGYASRIGDDDEGRAIGTSMIGEPRYVASIVALAATLTQKQELVPPQCDPALRDGLAPRPSTAVTSSAPAENFQAGGYTVIRDAFANARMRLVFDHGPLGFGGIAAHGHADALSLWLDIDDLPVLVDSGTYLYHSGGAWREFFRSTAAHNTLEVAGLSQSITAGAFNWRSKAKARCVKFLSGRDWEVEGAHDGYRARLGVEHQRAVRRTGQGFAVFDRLAGAKLPLPVVVRFLVHPDRTVAATPDRIVVCDGARMLLALVPPKGFAAAIAKGKDDRIGPGWYSPAFGRRVPAPCIVLAGNLGGDAAVTEFHLDLR
jgi:hypothetical protein